LLRNVAADIDEKPVVDRFQGGEGIERVLPPVAIALGVELAA